MRSVTRQKQERGVALLLAVFALMLLSAIGMTMLYSSDTETGVNNNFRDSQVATYAAMSGLQEARERLRQSAGTGDIPWPTDLPSAAAANVIYIINPAAGEVVAPWDPTNRYYDRDLCGGTYNMPSGFCNGTQPPGGAAWRVVYNNASSTLPNGNPTPVAWQRSVPLHYKWVRIHLKSDNMIAAVPTRTTGANGSIVCWDGSSQIPRPSGYGNDCAPDGSLVLVFDPNSQGGSGYNPGTGNEPTVTISAPGTTGGIQATATAHVETVSTGSLTSISVTNAGTGYTTIPTVTISPPDQIGGVQATAVAALPGSSVDSVSLGTADADSYCYTTGAPNVTFGSTGGGSGAEATAALGGSYSCIAGVDVTSNNKCSGMGGTSQTFQASGGGGSGFVGRITFAGNEKPSAWTVVSPGTGYSSVPNGTVTVGGCTQQVTFTLGRRVSSVTVNPHGTGYLTAPNVLFSAGASGSHGQPATAILGGGGGSGSAGSLVSIVLTHPGSGYSVAPTVTITEPASGGTQATAIANLGSTGRVTSVTLTNPGRNYPMSPNPTVTISPPPGGGTQAVATAHVAAGSTYGQVALITAFAETPTFGNRRGAQSVMQMEAATAKRDPWSIAIGGALTLAGPTPVFGTPNSTNFIVNGNDANSCNQAGEWDRPSIGVYDNPNAPADPSPIQQILGQLARPDHFIGVNGTADVQNVWGAIGGQAVTPQTLQQFTNNIAALVASGRPGAGTTLDNALNGNAASLTYIDGDASLSGSSHGHGVLVVTGTLTISGNYSWDGIILVIGEGRVVFSGGGNGQINGSIYVAKIRNDDGTLANDMLAPRIDYDGGGGNGIQYDHCLADNLLTGLPPVPAQADTAPMQILSVRRMSR